MTNHDLIAQVGGIERAREILEGAPELSNYYDVRFDVYIMCDHNGYGRFFELHAWSGSSTTRFPIHDDMIILLNNLRTAIANHTEFKVGDLVVSECDEDIPILFKTIEVQHASFDECVGCQSMSGLITCYLAINKIRHATPQEIKTGHRIELSGISGQLEVLEMIHISPSCVVIER